MKLGHIKAQFDVGIDIDIDIDAHNIDAYCIKKSYDEKKGRASSKCPTINSHSQPRTRISWPENVFLTEHSLSHSLPLY